MTNMRVEFTEEVLPEVLEALGFGIGENGFIIKNGELVEASDGDKIHHKNLGLIKKDEEDNFIIVRDNFAEMVNEVRSSEFDRNAEKGQ